MQPGWARALGGEPAPSNFPASTNLITQVTHADCARLGKRSARIQ